MDKNIHFLSQKTPENHPDFFTNKPKNSFKKKWKFYIFPAFVLIAAIWYGGYLRLFADPTPMAPNSVLDPTCDPTTPGCYVQIFPQQSASTSAGKILSSDGSNTLWVDNNGGVFPYAGQKITRDGWTGVSSSTLGSTSTTLAEFIQQVFFPAPAYVSASSTTVVSGLTTTNHPTATLTFTAASTDGACSGSTTLTCEHDGVGGTTLPLTLTGSLVTTPGSLVTYHRTTYHCTMSDSSPCTNDGSGHADGSYIDTTDSTVAYPINTAVTSSTAAAGISISFANAGAGSATVFTGAGSASSLTSITSLGQSSPIGTGQTLNLGLAVSGAVGTLSLNAKVCAVVSVGVYDCVNATQKQITITYTSGRVFWMASTHDYTGDASTTYATLMSALTGTGAATCSTTGGSGGGSGTAGCSLLGGAKARLVHIAPSSQFVFYMYPASLGLLSGIEGSFAGNDVTSLWNEQTINVQNSYGYSESYYLYARFSSGGALSLFSADPGGAYGTNFH